MINCPKFFFLKNYKGLFFCPDGIFLARCEVFFIHKINLQTEVQRMITLLVGIALAVLGIRVFLGLMGMFAKLSIFMIGILALAAFAAVIGLVFKMIFAAIPILLGIAVFVFVYRLVLGNQTA